MEKPIPKYTEDDEIMLEALIKSPAFASLRRVLGAYKDVAFSELRTAKETPEIFRLQGRLIGLEVVENLPGVIVAQRQGRIAKEEARAKIEAERKKRIEGTQNRG